MERPSPKRALVVALGNPLCGDDGFGAAVLERLAREPETARAADLLDAHTDLLGEIDRLAACEHVILLETLLDPGRPGEVETFEERTFAAWPETSPGSHEVSPLLALKLLRVLHPEARTRLSLVALRTDEIALGPPHFGAATVEAGAAAVLRLLGR